MLEREIKTFEANIEEWQRTKRGQFVLIKEDQIIGFYNNVDDALTVGAEKFGLQPFLVREIADHKEPVWIPALALDLIHAPHQHSVQGKNH